MFAQILCCAMACALGVGCASSHSNSLAPPIRETSPSMSPSQVRSLWIAGAFLGGAAVGALVTTPPGESQSAHALLLGGLSGAAAGLLTNVWIKDDEETNKLRQKLDLFEKGKTALEQEGAGTFRGNKEVSTGKKAKWRLYSTDRWIKQSPTKLEHVDHEVEIIPADTPPQPAP